MFFLVVAASGALLGSGVSSQLAVEPVKLARLLNSVYGSEQVSLGRALPTTLPVTAC